MVSWILARDAHGPFFPFLAVAQHLQDKSAGCTLLVALARPVNIAETF